MIVATRADPTDNDAGLAAINVMGLVDSIRHGLPINQLRDLTAPLHISQTELVDTLHIPRRTLARRNNEGVLSREESEKVLRLARVTARAFEVFDHQENAVRWLKSPNPALQGVTPLSLMDTGIGGEMVMDVLGRIEHGVFA